MSESAGPEGPGGDGKAPRDPGRRWTIVVGAALLFLLALQIASDRTAPVSSIGTVEGLLLPISSRISGELLRVAVSDDEVVEAGTLLFEIDPTPFRLAVEAAGPISRRSGSPSGHRPPTLPPRRRGSPRPRRC